MYPIFQARGRQPGGCLPASCVQPAPNCGELPLLCHFQFCYFLFMPNVPARALSKKLALNSSARLFASSPWKVPLHRLLPHRW